MSKGPYRTIERQRPNFIFAWRIARGMTQEELAERVGCATASISQMETGTREPSLTMLRYVAEALGVEPGWLLSRDPKEAADVWALVEELRKLPPAQRSRAAHMLRLLSDARKS